MNKQRLAHWYEQLEILEKSGVVGDAYGGTMHLDADVDWEVIFSFYEYITEVYKELPLWANAFIQIYSWQYQNFYEGLSTYYENLYEHTGYDSIMSTREFLAKEGYEKLAECYNHVLFEEDIYSLEEIGESFRKAEAWIGENDKVIQDFYIDVLKRHRKELEDEKDDRSKSGE